MFSTLCLLGIRFIGLGIVTLFIAVNTDICKSIYRGKAKTETHGETNYTLNFQVNLETSRADETKYLQ